MASVPAQEGPGGVAPPSESESLGTLTIDPVGTEESSLCSDNLNKQILSTKDEKIESTSDPHGETSMETPSERTDQPGSVTAADHNAVYQPTIYTPQAQAIYYGGFKDPPGKWDEYQFFNPEGIELRPQGAPSVMFHTGYGYSPQIPHGPYSPVATPLPSARGESQMYPTQQFQVTGPYVQQHGANAMPFLDSPTQASQTVAQMPFGFEQGFDGFGSSGLWSEWLKSPDRHKSPIPFSPAISPQPTRGLGPLEHSISPFSSGMGFQQQRQYGFGSSMSSYGSGYSHGRIHHQGANFGANLQTNDWRWVTTGKGRQRGGGVTAVCNYDGSHDFLGDQARGPRATRPKNFSADNNNIVSTAGVDCESYNKPDFTTEYEDAKFFIIKSYSEDNVHKSIKYGVWASTSNGNKKLDSAYREAKEKGPEAPVFLFFSVNASAQFCGVAEMIGPVDFEKSMDYWQQDRWTGHFPVQWHIIKDVANNFFRHIILENNDNKPVTNSRDTQEVKLEQGLEMLNILKNHEAERSILDDFDFYESRQKAMQERRARQQQQQPVMDGELHNPAPLPRGLITQMSKTFAQAVQLDENPKEDPAAGDKTSFRSRKIFVSHSKIVIPVDDLPVSKVFSQ
ncbi:hypothetical protein Taro_037262 [Colocasia esculenta]|uniref:YTH domain-containing family protein n=1 Tax=Colocasia esculenta TaxID=4460 RepID=A0A843WFQ8_COLES|nr:hypothetical protein [Colocasia esculenta]